MGPRFPRQSVTAKRAAQRSARAFLVRALSALAFVAAVVLPRWASAVILPLCEHDAMTLMPVSSLERELEGSTSISPPPPPCDEATDGGDSSAAPICDPDGASAVAPPRLLPVADARIEAVPSCGESSFVGPSIGPQRGDHPALTSPAVVDHAALTAALLVPPAPFVECAVFPAPTGGPRAGVANGVFRPPR